MKICWDQQYGNISNQIRYSVLKSIFLNHVDYEKTTTINNYITNFIKLFDEI